PAAATTDPNRLLRQRCRGRRCGPLRRRAGAHPADGQRRQRAGPAGPVRPARTDRSGRPDLRHSFFTERTTMTTAATRPNVLVLLNDHQAYYRHGWDAGPVVQRPHFDALARGGAVFERAYCAAPLCAPARRSLLTGLTPHQHGEVKNDVCHPLDRPTFPQALARAVYQTAWIGKWHAGPGTAADIGCHGFSYPSYSNPDNKPDHPAYPRRRDLPDPQLLIDRSFEPGTLGHLEGTLYRQQRDWSNEHATGVLTTPTATHEAYFRADLACRELEARADEEDPFFLFVSFWGP